MDEAEDLMRRESAPILTKKKIRELVEQIDPNERLDADVEAVRFLLFKNQKSRISRCSSNWRMISFTASLKMRVNWQNIDSLIRSKSKIFSCIWVRFNSPSKMRVFFNFDSRQKLPTTFVYRDSLRKMFELRKNTPFHRHINKN